MNHVLKTRGIPGVVYGASSIVRIHLGADAHALGLEDWTFDSARLARGMGPLGAKLHLAMLLNGVDYSRGSAIGAASLTGAVGAGRYEGQLGQMARELAATRQRLQREVALYRNAADLLRDPTTQVVTLRGLGPSAGATGRMIWHPAAGGQLVVANLPPAPPGKAYELWTIGEGAPRPAGVLRVDALGRATHRAEPVEGGVRVFAVTLEPERGVPAPTGPTVLASAK